MYDSIADFVIKIKNAGAVGKQTITVSYTKLHMKIGELLSKEGYVGVVEKHQHKGKKFLEVEILYDKDEHPHVQGVKRISKLSRRVYMGVRDIRPVRHGYGTQVVSTPEGVMTSTEAQKKGVGGEVLFEIW